MTVAIVQLVDQDFILVADGAAAAFAAAVQAQAAAAAAQAAADAAMAAAIAEGVYPDTTAGLAGTSSGDFFWVATGGEVTLYENDGGSAVELSSLATAADLAAVEAQIVPIVNGAIDDQVLDPFAADTGAALVGSDDGAAGTLWTTLAGFVAYLRSSAAAAILGFIQFGTGAIARTIRAKLGESVSVLDFGVVGDSNGTTGNGTDDTAAFLLARDAAVARQIPLHIPYGMTIRVTDDVITNTDFALKGVGAFINNAFPNLFSGRKGSWLYFDHTGKGLKFDLADPADVNYINIDGVGFIRNQPTPSGGAFTPTANDWDIEVSPTAIAAGGGFNVTIKNCLLLNPTKGIRLNRVTQDCIDNIRMQPMDIGIEVDNNFDVSRISNIHSWVFWSHATEVLDYTMATRKNIRLLRVDNPIMANIFHYGSAYGLIIEQGAAGSVSKLQVTNFGSDMSANGLVIDDGTSDVDVYLANGYFQGRGGGGASTGIQMLGDNGRLFGSNVSVNEMYNNGIALTTGTGNRATFNGLRIKNWDSSSGGFSGIFVDNGNVAIVTSGIDAETIGVGPVVTVVGTGECWGVWASWTPTVTATTPGSLATSTSHSSVFLGPDGKSVTFNTRIAFSNISGASGALLVSQPYGTASGFWVHGVVDRGTGVTDSISAWSDDGGSNISVMSKTNTFPTVSASSIFYLSGSYRRA